MRSPRWLVTFRSHAAGPADVTSVDVRAESAMKAIAAAKREAPPVHPWRIVLVRPWPSGARTIEAALRVG